MKTTQDTQGTILRKSDSGGANGVSLAVKPRRGR
jgi:hypothetical protein